MAVDQCNSVAGARTPARLALRLHEVPGDLKGDAAAVARHYDEHAQAEAARLERYSPVEYAITLRYLARFVPEGAAVAEVGVGAGHYSEFLARRGCRLSLLDVSESLLRAAQERLERAGLASQIAGIHHASATALPLADASLDAILLLGPLYHLRELRERERAVEEAARVLKPGGIVLAAGINRITFLRDMFRSPDAFSQAFFGDALADAGRAFGHELGRAASWPSIWLRATSTRSTRRRSATHT